MLGHPPTHLSACQELKDCESSSCQMACDGLLSLVFIARKAQGKGMKRKKEEEKRKGTW